MVEANYTLSNSQIILISIIVIWDFIWKCIAAWKAAEKKERFSFVILLLINSVGIIPILYLAYNKYAKKT
jgi:hypothetical protein